MAKIRLKDFEYGKVWPPLAHGNGPAAPPPEAEPDADATPAARVSNRCGIVIAGISFVAILAGIAYGPPERPPFWANVMLGWLVVWPFYGIVLRICRRLS